jgi:hypothetical protein
MNDNWFYLDAQNPDEPAKIGPLSKSQMDALAMEKSVLPDTMVWYPGLLNWITWKDAAPDFPGNSLTHRCSTCNSTKTENQMRYTDNRWICLACNEAVPMEPRTLNQAPC